MMNFSNKTTPIPKVKRENIITPDDISSHPNLESFKCETHYPLKIDAINVDKSDNSVSLLCIKCIIADNFFKNNADCKLVTIKELLVTCSNTLFSQKNSMVKSRDGLQDKFLGFVTRDYLGVYEKHLEGQYERIDSEITDLIDKLNQVRQKYREHYSGELQAIREQGSEIKEKISRFLESNGDTAKPAFSSLSEIYDQIDQLKNQEELTGFLQDLYIKSSEGVEDVTCSDESRRLLASLEDVKEKASNLKNNELELSSFESMKHTLQNILSSTTIKFKNSRAEAPKVIKRENKSSFGLNDTLFNSLKPEKNTEMDTESEYSPDESPERKSYRTPPTSRGRGIKDETSTKKKIQQQKLRLTDIGSQSLRNLRKDIEKEVGDDDSISKPKTKERILLSLNEWINRRVTGYLVFQNTLNSDPETAEERQLYADKGIHLNKIMGEKWKKLSQREREEFKALAKEQGSIMKDELVETIENENINSMLEILDEKIKKIKRE